MTPRRPRDAYDVIPRWQTANRNPETGTGNGKPKTGTRNPEPETGTGKPKRGWSREFPTGDDDPSFFLSHIPADLWREIRAQATLEGVSMRTLILQLLSAWLAQPPASRRAGRGQR